MGRLLPVVVLLFLLMGRQWRSNSAMPPTHNLDAPLAQVAHRLVYRIADLFNKTDAGNVSYGICCVSNILRSPSLDPRT
jgi:hypothetical protein